MGLYINAYGIKLEEVNAILGSKDEALYRRILERNSFYKLDEPLGHGMVVSEIPISRAIRDFVYGKPDDIKVDAAYAFALFCICRSVRKDLPHGLDIKSIFETSLINTYLAKDFNLRNFDIEIILANPFRLFNLPDIYEELVIEPYECPVMGVLTQPNLRYLKSRFRNIKINMGMIYRLINSRKIKIDDIELINRLINNDDPQAVVLSEDQIKGYEHQNIKWIIEDIDYCLDNKLEMFTTLG